MVIANSEEEARKQLCSFFETISWDAFEKEMRAEGWLDHGTIITMLEHEIVDGLIFGDYGGYGMPKFYEPEKQEA